MCIRDSAPVARAVAHQVPDAQFLWWGLDLAGERVDEVRRDLQRCGVAERVRLMESTSAPQHLLHACDVFWSASREDPYPLTLAEAARAGVPIVASDAGGATELLGRSDERGLLVPPIDAAAAAGAIVALAESPVLRSRLASASADFVAEELSFDHFAADVANDLTEATRQIS